MDRESQLVKRITRALSSGKSAPVGLHLGIGDDAAILSLLPRAPHKEWVLSCDASIDDIHFNPKIHPPDSVGYKALARATSDLAAMGATPRFFLMTLALPSGRTGAWLTAFLQGMARASHSLGIHIIGGDTTRSRTIFVSITVLGEIASDQALTRSGARVGDHVYVSGKLGRAQLGLELALRGCVRDRKSRALLQPHLYPKIRIELGSWLAHHHGATSMMDLSDGLSIDLTRLCAASRVGARIYANKVPVVAIPSAVASKLGKYSFDPLHLALQGGEDYELLFTVPPRQIKKLRHAPQFSSLTAIGEITRNREILLVHADHREVLLKPAGWDPFR